MGVGVGIGRALEHEVDVLVVVGAQHVPQLDDVFVIVQLLQKPAHICQAMRCHNAHKAVGRT